LGQKALNVAICGAATITATPGLKDCYSAIHLFVVMLLLTLISPNLRSFWQNFNMTSGFKPATPTTSAMMTGRRLLADPKVTAPAAAPYQCVAGTGKKHGRTVKMYNSTAALDTKW
jgi:hypothetical protein